MIRRSNNKLANKVIKFVVPNDVHNTDKVESSYNGEEIGSFVATR